MNNTKEHKFRFELKYYINYEQYIILSERLKHMFKQDLVANREYNIRSLYFDDVYHSAEAEKYCGVSNRSKYRIRIYNYSDQQIKMEKKTKQEQFVYKDVHSITKDTYNKLILNQTNDLEVKGNDLMSEWLFKMKNYGLKPAIVVDYNREAFIMEQGDVRITFDKDLRFAGPRSDIFNSELMTRPVLQRNMMILEVKFSGFLPSIVKDVLQVGSLDRTAISKYILCLEKNKTLGGLLHE
ncbi:MAG: hypothetical protein K0R15_187 [Clostridiales bacterium]|jgi:hypothetical protein|nr:hypothetical protein [Clostridiales bacterium]